MLVLCVIKSYCKAGYCTVETDDLKRNYRSKSFTNRSIIHITMKYINDRNAASLVIATVLSAESPNCF